MKAQPTEIEIAWRETVAELGIIVSVSQLWEGTMKLTVINRLKLCFEILTITSGHKHSAFEKNLSTFSNGYQAGRLDTKLEYKNHKTLRHRENRQARQLWEMK